MRVRVLSALALIFAATIASCHGCAGADDASESVHVSVLTDLTPGSEFDSIRLAARGVTRLVPVESDEAWVPAREVALLPLDAGDQMITVELTHDDVVVLTRSVLITVSDDAQVTVVLTRACLGVTCADGTVCHGGQCADARCSPAAPERCPAEACSKATDCARPVACLTASCVAGLCLTLADDFNCGDAERCDPASGCVAKVAEVRSCAGQAAGVVCRQARGGCDVAEVCDGQSDDCPADTFTVSGVVCRPASDVCDVAEVCSGASPSCPRDVMVAEGTICGAPPTGACDRQDTCDGVSPTCRDVLQLFGIVCRERADADVPVGVGSCDLVETCDGVTKDCPPDERAPPTKICRQVTDGTETCDVAELCGGLNRCPPDAFLPAGTLCRPAGGECDLDDRCSGVSPTCADDRRTGQLCRAAVGPCDAPEVCAPTDNVCPPDLKHGPSYICRAAAGGCDIPEYCDGASNACIAPDLYRPAGYVCRPGSGDDECGNQPERCSGGPNCPPDTGTPTGTCCSDPTGQCASGYRSCSGGTCSGSCKGPSACD